MPSSYLKKISATSFHCISFSHGNLIQCIEGEKINFPAGYPENNALSQNGSAQGTEMNFDEM